MYKLLTFYNLSFLSQKPVYGIRTKKTADGMQPL